VHQDRLIRGLVLTVVISGDAFVASIADREEAEVVPRTRHAFPLGKATAAQQPRSLRDESEATRSCRTCDVATTNWAQKRWPDSPSQPRSTSSQEHSEVRPRLLSAAPRSGGSQRNSAPLAITTLLLSGANSVLTDLGDLVGAARGPVTAPTLVRYVVEHIAEIHWLLSPWTYTLDEGDPMEGLSERELDELFLDAQQIRVRRAALRTYRWTLELQHGRLKPAPGDPRSESLPKVSPEDLESILGPHGLRSANGLRLPSEIAR
jgi:hypothetical protein